MNLFLYLLVLCPLSLAMEIQAAYIKETTSLDVDPTSMFDVQVKRLHEYLAERWSQHGSLNSRGTVLHDRHLWRYLLELRARHTIRWQWIKSHNGHRIQTVADELAYMEARRQQVALRLAA